MNDLVDFTKRVENLLSNTKREPHWEPTEAEQYMAEIATRRSHFEHLAMRLSESIIQPRLETLACYFPNASLAKNGPIGHCSYWFGYCEQFPSSTKITISIEHDIRYQSVAICYEATMVPVFFKLNEREKLTFPVEGVQEDEVALWVEERLVEFLDAYLRIDRGGQDFNEETATDPVCGMRIGRASAVASDSYRGHPYFFCSRECQESFVRNPAEYVEVKDM